MRLTCWIMIAAWFAALAPSSPACAQDSDVRRSVVKILCTRRPPDPFRPWSKEGPVNSSASGVVIDGKRILTNAHAVAFESQLYVQPYQSAEKYEAKVIARADGVDLAVLELDDEAFFDDHPALPFAEALPKVRDQVNAYGYPTGGQELSVTEGIVSRIEYVKQNFGVLALRIQVDAALNPGNSGGPAVNKDGRIVGLVFSGIRTADNIGYLIPVEEIQRFLRDIADGVYHGKMMLHGIGLQEAENDALRERLGLTAEQTGVVVNAITRPGNDYPLKIWDVITHIGTHAIDNDGLVQVQPDLRLMFSYYIPQIVTDGKIPLTLIREGKTMSVQVPVEVEIDRLVPVVGYEYPSYFIYGPVCFTPVTSQFVGAVREYVPQLTGLGSPIISRINDLREADGEELVAVSAPLFPHRLTKGYKSPVLAVVETVNDVKVRNLAHLVKLLRDSKEEYIVFRFVSRSRPALVFKRAEVVQATEEILTDNGIRHRGTEELMEIWQEQ